MAAMTLFEKILKSRQINYSNFYRYVTNRRLSSLPITSKSCLINHDKTKTTSNCPKISIPLNKNYGTKPPTIDDFRAKEEQREQEYANQQETEEIEEKPEENEKATVIRKKILDASLPFVETHGWSRKAITNGAESVGYPGVTHGLFPKGGIELIEHFNSESNKRLIDQLIKDGEGRTGPPNPKDYAINAVKLRLMMIEPYLSSWPQALALMSLPQNASHSLANLLTLVDDICYFAGDRSVDFSWYSRRVGLAAILKMTEIYMLQDSTVDHSSTWKFLEKRIEEAMTLQDMLIPSAESTSHVQQALGNAFTTARNILGINFNRR